MWQTHKYSAMVLRNTEWLYDALLLQQTATFFRNGLYINLSSSNGFADVFRFNIQTFVCDGISNKLENAELLPNYLARFLP